MTNKNDIFKRKKVKEEDFLKVLDNISKKLIYKFKFGYHDIDDMKQQAAIFALEGLENYDNKRPLENFLWTHVRNRLFNFKRDHYYRPDNVCASCPFFDPKFKVSSNQCTKFTNKNECPQFSQWSNRNNLKKSLMQPISIDMNEPGSNSISDIISDKELLSIIEDKIHIKYRESYLKLKGGSKLPKQELKKLQNHIIEIINNHE